MAYLVYIGSNTNNLHGLSSKGYHIIRRANDVIITYGAVVVSGRMKKRITWCKGYMIKVKSFKNKEDAEYHRSEKIKRRIRHGYEKISTRIYKR